MSNWTAERIELLKQLWLNGVTSTEIAGQLDISRNAVLGKIKRLGLNRYITQPEHPSPVPSNSKPVSSKSGKTVSAGAKRKNPAKPASEKPEKSLPIRFSRPRNQPKPARETPPARKVSRAPTALQARYLRIWDLQEGCCKWPLGEAMEKAEFFCGAPSETGTSWCSYHCAIAFPKAHAPKPDMPQRPHAAAVSMTDML